MGRLLISAAHTLENPGAIYQDLREADLTRKLLKFCIPHLEKTGLEFQAVPLDLPLLQRIEWINATGYSEEQGDIMVELHINDGGKRGIEGWYEGAAGPNNKSQRLTERLSEYICDKLGYTNLGSKSEYEHELTSLLILNSINPAGTAMEVLFIDNPDDIAILKDDKKLDDVAKIIVEGIKDYLDEPDKGSKSSQNTPKNSDTNVPAGDSQQKQLPPRLMPQPITSRTSPQDSFGGFGGGNAPLQPQRPFGTGGFGGNSPFASPYGGAGAGGFGSGGMGGNKATLMDRDERKKMIKEVYQLILGRDPKPADENYYLNTGATKEELINKLTESEDFKNMIEDSKKFKELDTKVKQLEAEIETLKANNADSDALKESMQKLLDQKNVMISRLYSELVNHGIIQTGEHFESRKSVTQEASNTNFSQEPDSLGKKLARLIMKITRV